MGKRVRAFFLKKESCKENLLVMFGGVTMFGASASKRRTVAKRSTRLKYTI